MQNRLNDPEPPHRIGGDDVALVMEQLDAKDAEIARLSEAIRDACDLLAERTHGNPARSAGHNARLRLEAALKD